MATINTCEKDEIQNLIVNREKKDLIFLVGEGGAQDTFFPASGLLWDNVISRGSPHF